MSGLIIFSRKDKMAKRKAKSVLKSKTMWASIATVATGIGMYFAGEQSMQELLVSLIGVIFGVLRFVTDEPVR